MEQMIGWFVIFFALNSDVRGLIVPPFESTISLVPPVTQETTTENPESQESREIYSKEQSQFTTTIPPDPSTHPAYEKQSAHEDPPKHHPYYETKSPEEQLEDTSHPISPSIHDYNQKPRSYDNQDPPRHHTYYQTSEEQPEYTTPPSPSMHEYYRKPRSSDYPGIQDDDSQFENNDRPIHHVFHGQGDRRVFHYHHHYHHHQQPDYDSSIHKHHRIDPNPVDPSIDHYRTKPVDDSSNSESQEEPTRHKYRPKSEDQDPALIHKQHRQLNDIDPNQDDPPIQHRNPVDDDSPESGEVPYRHSTTEAYEPSIHHTYSGPNDPYVHHYHPNPSSEEDDDQPINHKYRTTTESYNPSIHHAYSGPNDPYVHHYHPKSSSEEDYDRPIKHKYRTTTEPNDPYVHHLIPNPENDPSTQNYNSNSNNPFVHQYHPQPGDDSDNSEAGTDSSESSTQVFRKQMFGSGNTFVVCILFFCFGI
uniref:Uncharacterized protein n=1 Tax=Cacopsylla melanoneura TaxID=428564 RepID=A0A8D8Z123_9HEMI